MPGAAGSVPGRAVASYVPDAAVAATVAAPLFVPGVMLPRRADTVEVVAEALVSHAGGQGHRPIAARLGRPAATIRVEQTLQHATRWLICLDVGVIRIEPGRHATPTHTALSVLAAAAAAADRQLGCARSRWEVVSALCSGRLLTNTNCPPPLPTLTHTRRGADRPLPWPPIVGCRHELDHVPRPGATPDRAHRHATTAARSSPHRPRLRSR